MSGPLGSSQWMYASGAASFYDYSIDQSLRFNDNDSAHLNFTPSSAGDQKTWTWSAWIKRGTLGTKQNIFNPTRGGDATNESQMDFTTNDQFQIYDSGALRGNKVTTRKFRDTSSWYHIVVALDTTDATAADRVKIYVNGERETAFSTNSNPALNTNWGWNAAHEHSLGSYNYGADGSFFDGYMAEVHFIDGTALDPTSFGEISNGAWVPKAYSGSYGTNGWYLPFDDSSAIGDDESGNTNDWTANNLAAIDVVPDSPTLNYPTFNPSVNTGQTLTHSEGNLEVASSSFWSSSVWSRMTMAGHGGSTGKFYAEFVNYGSSGGGSTVVGIGNYDSLATNTTNHNDAIIYYYNTVRQNGTSVTLGGNYSSTPGISGNEVVRMAWDCSNGKVWLGASQEWFDVGSGVGDPANDSNPSGTISNFSGSPIGVLHNRSTNTGRCIMNFGQNGTFNNTLTAGGYTDENGDGDFYYQVPSGFVALNSANLPEPTIGPNSDTQADDHFNTVLYTGDGTSSNAITGVGFQPDWVWIKQRTDATSHQLFDVIRGATKIIKSDTTGAEVTNTNTLTSFDSDGFTVGTANAVNGSSDSLVSWNWKAGGTAVSNSDGSLTCNVSANTDAGFSIVTWTADSDNGTLGHGLNSAPEMIIAKPLGSGTNWYVMHTPGGVVPATNVLNLDSTADDYNPGLNHFNDTYPTSTVFSYGGYLGDDLSNDDKVAYLFHSVEGYSKIHYYKGNASATDGPFVYTGFRPAFVMGKAIGQTGRWWMYDSARTTYNDGGVNNGRRLEANSSSAESTSDSSNMVEFYSNGFKVNTTNSEWNGSGLNYIYLAFAEVPFKYANAR